MTDSTSAEKRGWQREQVGCYWHRGGISISTYRCGSDSGYLVTSIAKGEIGKAQTFAAAERLADRRKGTTP